MKLSLAGGPLDGREARVHHGFDWYVVHCHERNLVYRWCELRCVYRFIRIDPGTLEMGLQLFQKLNRLITRA